MVKSASTSTAKLTHVLGGGHVGQHREPTPVTGDSGRAAWLRQARSYLRAADPVLAGLIDARPGFDPRARLAELTAIPEIGPWTVQGALIIAFGREDVVLPGDLGLRKAVRSAYRLDKLPAPEEVRAIADKWRPYRSLATSYLFSAAFEPAGVPPVGRHQSAGT